MPSPFDRSHLRIDGFATAKAYQSHRPPPRNGLNRATAQHAEGLKRELASAWAAVTDLTAARDEVPVGKPGRYLDFEVLPFQPLPNLEWAREDIRLARTMRFPDGSAYGTLYVPDASRQSLVDRLDEYKTRRGTRGRPAHENRFAALEHLSAARLESIWVDSRPLPIPGVMTWWECWCWPDRVDNLLSKATAAGVLVSASRLTFAERVVRFIYADRVLIAQIIASNDAVAEIRLGRDDASFFTTGTNRDDQGGWVANAAERLILPVGRDGVSICLLDTGLNRAHPLLSPVFSGDDLHSVDLDWGVDDHHGHGSEMAGLGIYGDLTAVLASAEAIYLPYIGESVKLLAPDGFAQTEPSSYGLATRQAVFRVEIAKPLRERVFCMAITQRDVYGPRATSWSASLDGLAFGGDELDDLRPRLFCVSAGNLPDAMTLSDLENWDDFEIEDPAQAWNILTVGGYTEKASITEQGIEHWLCAALVGHLVRIAAYQLLGTAACRRSSRNWF